MDAYSKQTSRKKYAKNTDYHNFKNAVWVMSQEGAMPPVRDLIPAEEGDEQDDSDDEILQGGLTQNFRCPLTTNILEDPLTKYVAHILNLNRSDVRTDLFTHTIPFFPAIAHPTITARIAGIRTLVAPSPTTSPLATTDVQPQAVWPPSLRDPSRRTPTLPRRWQHSRGERKKGSLLDVRPRRFSTDMIMGNQKIS